MQAQMRHVPRPFEMHLPGWIDLTVVVVFDSMVHPCLISFRFSRFIEGVVLLPGETEAHRKGRRQIRLFLLAF